MSSWSLEHPYLTFIVVMWTVTNIFYVMGKLISPDEETSKAKKADDTQSS